MNGEACLLILLYRSKYNFHTLNLFQEAIISKVVKKFQGRGKGLLDLNNTTEAVLAWIRAKLPHAIFNVEKWQFQGPSVTPESNSVEKELRTLDPGTEARPGVSDFLSSLPVLLPLAHSMPATLNSLLFLKHARHSLTYGFPLAGPAPGIFFSPYICWFSFTLAPSLCSHPIFMLIPCRILQPAHDRCQGAQFALPYGPFHFIFICFPRL